MASQYPAVKGSSFTLDFVIRRDDGTVIGYPTITSIRICKDGGASVAATNTATIYDTTYGILSLVLTAAEMNADRIVVYITASSPGAIPTVIAISTAAQTEDAIATAVSGIPAAVLVTPAQKIATDGNGRVAVYSNSDKAGYGLTSAYDAAKGAAQVSDVTAVGSIASANSTAIAALPSASAIATAVWSAGSRTLTSFGTLIADIWSYATRTLSDKTGFALTSAYDAAKTANSVAPDNATIATISGKVANLPTVPASKADVDAATGAAVTAGNKADAAKASADAAARPSDVSGAQSAIIDAIPSVSGLATEANATSNKNAVISAMPSVPTASEIATAVEGHLLNEGDGQKLLEAIVNAVNAADVDLQGLSTATIAAAVANALFATPGNKLDVDGQGRVTTNNEQDLTPVLEAVGALHDFDPVHDTVARVSLTDVATNLTNAPQIPSGLALKSDVDYAQYEIINSMPDPVDLSGIARIVDVTDARDTIVDEISGINVDFSPVTAELDEMKIKLDSLENLDVKDLIGQILADMPQGLTAEEVWTYIDRQLTTFDFDIYNVEEVSQLVADAVLSEVKLYSRLEPGPGTGSFRFEDKLTGLGGRPISDALIRAYPYDVSTNAVNFNLLLGSCHTEKDGSYHLNLDPGTYARRVWKNGTVVLDDKITIE